MDLARRKAACPLPRLQALARRAPPVRPFDRALREQGVSLIAEMKKASPSAGLLRALYDPAGAGRAYERGGAGALSVLTEENFFLGRLSHLTEARRATCLPVLRKDFLVEPYQVHESRAAGADAVLLIVALLRPWELARLLAETRRTGMTPLVEVHDRTELDVALTARADVIGVNSRNLKDLSMNPGVFKELIPRIPKDRIVVAESGVKSGREVRDLNKLGAHAVLVGESLLRQPDLESATRSLIEP